MLDTRQRKALGLLFKMSPEAVEKKLRLRKGRIYAWLNYVPFQRALASRLRHSSDAASRMGVNAVVSATRRMAVCVRKGGPEESVAAARSILQMSGALKQAVQPPSQEQEEESLQSIIASCRSRPSGEP